MLPQANGRKHKRGSALRELEHERGRGRIEQMRIVDPDDQGASIGEIAQRLDASSKQLERVVGPNFRRDQARKRAERHACGGPRRLHPGDPGSLDLGLRERRARESGLPHASGRTNHHPGQTVCPRASDQRQLLLTTDQRSGPLRNQQPMR